MKICKKCGTENMDSNYMCEKCGNALSNVEDKMVVENQIECPKCGMMNKAATYVCKYCNSSIPSDAKRITVEKGYNTNSYDYYPQSNHVHWTKSKVGIVLITYVVYLVLLGVGDMTGGMLFTPIILIDLIIGWMILSDLDKEHFAFLGGLAGWMDAGGSGCGGIMFFLVAKFFISFFVGLFFSPLKIGLWIYDIIL